MAITNIRIGQGIDVHAFGGDKPLILGGVIFEKHIGLKAHSDGDALIHALCDALLGAAGLGDIGTFFPSEDKKLENQNSRTFLTQCVEKLQGLQFTLVNADLTILSQTPKILPHVKEMKTILAQDLQCDTTQLNLKATTTDKLGFLGRKEGLMASAIVLLAKD